MSDDLTPSGDPIDTHTLWLEFPEGEGAITLDLTRWNAALKRVQDSLPRCQHGPTADYGDG